MCCKVKTSGVSVKATFDLQEFRLTFKAKGLSVFGVSTFLGCQEDQEVITTPCSTAILWHGVRPN